MKKSEIILNWITSQSKNIIAIPSTLKIKNLVNNANSQKFMSQKQFKLEKINGIWHISHSTDAKNITNINGKPIGYNPQPLNNGDTISLGKSGQVPIKVKFN